MPIPSDQIDPDARKILKRLVRANYQAYLVGGCVRDLLLERTPKDFDIATSATPNEVKSLFRNCRIIGRRFRLAHIFFGSKIIETATFRANPREVEAGTDDEEGVTPSHEAGGDILIRRDNVFGNAEEDARRRDFTINGLFYDIEADQVIDYVGGLEDLAGRLVRTIGDPEIRFREDPVRILRAIKFAARLDFDIETEAWQAILDHKGEIPKCAPPRVLEEIYRLMKGGAARRSMELLRDTGVLDLLIPEVARLLRERPDSEEAHWLWKVLDRIDAKRAAPSNAVLLCALMGPFVGEALFEEPASGPGSKTQDIGLLIEERTKLLMEQLRASRRDVERSRQMLLAQRRIAPTRKRRVKPMTLVRRDYFEEALQVYDLVGGAVSPDPEAAETLEQWRKMLVEGEPGAGAISATAPAADAASTEGGPKRRRRRRGGRRFRRGADGQERADQPLDDEFEDGEEVEVAAAVGQIGAPLQPGSAHAPVGESMSLEPAPAADLPDLIDQVPAQVPADQTSAAPPSTGNTTPVR